MHSINEEAIEVLRGLPVAICPREMVEPRSSLYRAQLAVLEIYSHSEVYPFSTNSLSISSAYKQLISRDRLPKGRGIYTLVLDLHGQR